MKDYCKVSCVASRGRGDNNIQHFEARTDGCTSTITSITKDNYLMELTEHKPNMTYHEHPTKEDLLKYFGQRIRVRKMTEREAMRLMDVEDSDIDKMMNATETVTLKSGETKTRKAISKTAMYKLAGNSIVVSCLYHIFFKMFIDTSADYGTARYHSHGNHLIIQPSLF